MWNGFWLRANPVHWNDRTMKPRTEMAKLRYFLVILAALAEAFFLHLIGKGP
jgi:hypothetical protein